MQLSYVSLVATIAAIMGYGKFLRRAIPLAAVLCLVFLYLHEFFRPEASLLPPSFKSLASSLPPDYLAEAETKLAAIRTAPATTEQFRVVGDRAQELRRWLETRDQLSFWQAKSKAQLDSYIEEFAKVDFSFLAVNQSETTPIQNLRQSYIPGSKGIVIPTGKSTFRYACHLVSNLRHTLGSKLPIQIFYAGDHDLPPEYRAAIVGLGSDVETVDITDIFDESKLDLTNGKWAIKPFAALGSIYEQVLVLDADTVFVQPPERILESVEFLETGTSFFHDRLLWKGSYKARHKWWEDQLQGLDPSPALRESKVYNEGYAEEMDSGVVALDKSRLPIFTGMLHICWQNSKDIREFTYKQTYGDKESWWFGLELSGATYAFEPHYGAIAGYIQDNEDDEVKVCSFTIAHMDRNNTVLWYNGSLLKNKAVDKTGFSVPSHWMLDGVWEKGHTKQDISCMRDGKKIGKISLHTRRVIEESVAIAKRVDQDIEQLVDWS